MHVTLPGCWIKFLYCLLYNHKRICFCNSSKTISCFLKDHHFSVCKDKIKSQKDNIYIQNKQYRNIRQRWWWKATQCQVFLVNWEMIVFCVFKIFPWQIQSVNKGSHSHVIIQFQRFIANHVKTLHNAALTRQNYWFC